MKYLKQFGIILLIAFAGEVLHALLPLPIPAGIYGIILLFLCLCTKLLPVSAIKETSVFLIEIMPVMFIPAAVGLLDSWDSLKPVWIPVILITILSTIIVIGVTGQVTQRMIHKEKMNGEKDERISG